MIAGDRLIALRVVVAELLIQLDYFVITSNIAGAWILESFS